MRALDLSMVFCMCYLKESFIVRDFFQNIYFLSMFPIFQGAQCVVCHTRLVALRLIEFCWSCWVGRCNELIRAEAAKDSIHDSHLAQRYVTRVALEMHSLFCVQKTSTKSRDIVALCGPTTN